MPGIAQDAEDDPAREERNGGGAPKVRYPASSGHSPLRNKRNWVIYAILPAVGALSLSVIQGTWEWGVDKVTESPDPPALKITTDEMTATMWCKGRSAADGSRREYPVGIASGEPGTALPITFQARSDRPVIVQGVQINKLAHTDVPQACGSSGEGVMGPVPRYSFDVDLNSRRADVRPQNRVATTREADAVADFPFVVPSKEPGQLVLNFKPVRGMYTFSVTVEWKTADGKVVRETFDNHGSGYRVMGKPLRPGSLPPESQEDIPSHRFPSPELPTDGASISGHDGAMPGYQPSPGPSRRLR